MNSATMPAFSRAAAEVDTRSSSGWELYRGIKNMLRCDEAEVVQGIAHYVISQYRGLRWLSILTERTDNTPIPGVVALVGW
jgi:hypothetical protein